MADVFISYNQADRDLVRLTAAFLEANGYTVWWDTSLLAGDDFQLKILDEVAKARAVIVIWTPSSTKSTWVRAEAGRAQSDHKLIPLKAAGVTYDEIPPPFNLLHTEDASNREAVLLSVKAQMGKPAPAPVLIKRARYEVLAWIGAIGASISIFAHLNATMQFAKLLRHAAQQWEDLLWTAWRYLLFFWPKLAKSDALTLSFLLFFVVSLVSAQQALGDANAPAHTIPKSLFASALIIILILSIGYIDVFYDPLGLSASLISSLDDLLPLGDRDSVISVSSFIFGRFVFLTMLAALPCLLIVFHEARHLGTRLLKTVIAFAIIGGILSVVSLLLWTFEPTSRYMNFLSDAPLALAATPFVLLFASIIGLVWAAIANVIPITLDLRRLNGRLWRIIAGIALLTAVNYGMLWLEKQPWAAEMLK